jgi:hypothetical protein
MKEELTRVQLLMHQLFNSYNQLQHRKQYQQLISFPEFEQNNTRGKSPLVKILGVRKRNTYLISSSVNNKLIKKVICLRRSPCQTN